ncbi:MAG: response regulator [Rhodospirillaceae bacterium]|nr:response regulator [Rhodospirillaceae bacterium]
MIAVDGFFIAGIIGLFFGAFWAGYGLRTRFELKSWMITLNNILKGLNYQAIVASKKKTSINSGFANTSQEFTVKSVKSILVKPLLPMAEREKAQSKVFSSFWIEVDLLQRKIIQVDEKLQFNKYLFQQPLEIILLPYLNNHSNTPIFINLLNDKQQKITIIALHAPADVFNQQNAKFNLLVFQGVEAEQFNYFQQELLKFIQELPIGVGVLSEQAQFVQANQKLEQQIYRTATSLEEKALGDLSIFEDERQIEKNFQEALNNHQTQYIAETKWKTNKGQTSQLILQPWPWFNFVILYALDITLQRRLESQVNQSQKMQAIGQLAGGIAHDFNNLLTAMIGFCDLLLIRHRPGDQSFADIMQIKQNSHRAANLVRQLLAFSRQQNLQPKVLVLTDLLAELSHLLKRLIGANVELDIIHGQNLFSIKADPTQLEQVIINLAVNARDAMPSGGKLLITTQNRTLDHEINVNNETIPSGDYVLLSIEDNGTGISSEIMDRIFDPFFSTKEIGKGTGLGLSTVYGIIKQTKGYIFVESALGKGTVFYIYLPKYQAEQNIKEINDNDLAASKIEDLTGVGNILLVEDEDAVRIFSARALRNKGYQVIEARSGEAALEIIKQQVAPIDLLVSDVMMPQMDGPTLIREAHKIIPDLKVIFISGYAEDSFRQRLQNDQGIQFLPKPFSLKQLAEKVQNVLKTKR